MKSGNTVVKHKYLFRTLYFCLFGLAIIIGIIFSIMVKNEYNDNDNIITYIENWTVIDKNLSSFEAGRSYSDKRAYTEDFTAIAKMPDKIKDGQILCFMNMSSVSVYIDGHLRKDFNEKKDVVIPGGLLKEIYIQVPLSSKDAGAELKIIRKKTDRNPMIVSETIISSSQGIKNYMFHKYGITFILSVLLFVASLLAFFVGTVMRLWLRQQIDMLYAVSGIFNVACWLIAVSQFTPFICGIYFVDGFMGFIFCMMMPFGFMVYFNSLQKNRYRKVHVVAFIASIFNLFFWTTLHFLGIQSLLKSLFYIDLILGAIIVLMLYTLVIDLKKGNVKDYSYTAKGFLFFMVMALVEIIKVIYFENLINEIPMLIGLFGLLIMVVLQQIEDIRKTREVLRNEIHRKNVEKEHMLINIVETLAGTIDAKDQYTKGHSSRVADYAREIAKRAGYNETELNDLYIMGLLHDIGKIGIPDTIINKNGKLTKEEYDMMKKHPVIGSRILQNMKEKTGMDIGARSHHERYDGNGYPDGISGKEIPEQARIIAVADAYDAMTSYRSYRDPMTQERVRKEIENGRGTQFDPYFAKIMLEMIDDDKDYEMREKKNA
ncbi:MAG: HD domain-containing protein [Lachnospiraceae bacterium]|nr:HD domain-containing protein [Lachnospiraceae bacterium]